MVFTGARVSATQILQNNGDHGNIDNDPNSDGFESQPENDHLTSSLASSDVTFGRAADIHPNLLSPLVNCSPHPIFTTEQLGVDRRLIVNRKRQLKMYRVWMQGKFRKL